jgi:UDP-N-acetylmuramoyl-tripeptide--D-alanyl-D-alanine ligase
MRPLWNAEDLLNATGGSMAEKFAATGVSIDTRTLQPGDLFVALVGENGNGHVTLPQPLPRVPPARWCIALCPAKSCCWSTTRWPR